MRGENRNYLGDFLKEKGPFQKVLEIGSLDVNGHVRDLFKDCEYTGVDMRPGGNVDVVLNAHDLHLRYEPETFDFIFSFDTFEHDDYFWKTWENMKVLVKKGGWLMLAVPSRYCPEHDHPHDYWRFMPQSFTEYFFQGFTNVTLKIDRNGNTEDEIIGWGQKP